MTSDSSQAADDQRDPAYRVSGRRIYSIGALQERIEAAFVSETRPEALLGISNDTARRDLIREVADYVLAVESIRLARPDYLALIDSIHAILFRFGPLDPYLSDETVTEITIDGPERVHVRHNADDLEAVPEHFLDSEQLARIVARLLATVGTTYGPEAPFVEVGLTFGARPARLSVTAPPISVELQAEIRLHPSRPLTLADLVARAVLPPAAADYLQAAIADQRGIMLAGEPGAGKTTLIQALLFSLPPRSAIIERAAELRFPAENDFDSHTGSDFAAEIDSALAKAPPRLVIDEIRSDESTALWPALTATAKPALLWAFRGSTNPLRLRTAFNMTIRRAHPTLEQDAITDALLTRLPIAALVARQNGALRLVTLGEWRRTADGSVTLQSVLQ